MKTKFYTLLGMVAIVALVASCSAPRYAGAQPPDDVYYDNPQPPAQQQEVYDDNQYSQDQPQQDVDFNTFYDELSPYGTWENDPAYGQVWAYNDPNFTPYYSGGNWAYTNAGWAWVSTYNWGWAPFHYGRWAYTNRWVWVPGYEWAPAWVSWRSGGDYYGWAPLGPGITIGVGYGNYIPAERWNFCRRGYITSPRFTDYCLGRGQNITVIRNTTIINNINVYHNTRFIGGPDRREVERYTGNRITQVNIRNAARPGANIITRNELQVYRPNVRPAGNGRFVNNQPQDNRGGNVTTNPAGGQGQPNNQPRPNSSYNRPWYSPAPQHNNNVPAPQNQPQPNRQPDYNNRPQYQPQQPVPNQRPVYQQPQPAPQQRPVYQQPVRPQYQPQQQPARQPVYNNDNRPQYQPQQRQYQPQQRQYQPQPQQRSYSNSRPASRRP